MRHLLILITLLLGCSKPDAPTDWRGQCRILPIIITKNGTTNWEEHWIKKQEEWSNFVFEKSGLSFQFSSPRYIEDGFLYEMTSVGFSKVVVEAGFIVNQEKIFPVWFVNNIMLGDFEAAGVSNYPSNVPGFNNGIALAANSQECWDLAAHELGHSFNLPHPWEDNFEDTLQTDINQECSIQPCNIMNYCFPSFLTCENEELLTKNQINEIRKWSVNGPRTKVVTTVAGIAVQKTVEYTNNTEPQIDSVEYFSK